MGSITEITEERMHPSSTRLVLIDDLEDASGYRFHKYPKQMKLFCFIWLDSFILHTHY